MPIDCFDDASAHLPLSISKLPNGLQFDGQTLSGRIIEGVVHHSIFVYNNETSYQIILNGMKLKIVNI